ncbi:MAG: hypothetical protein ABIK23_02800 [candidate division WOR-3 bacterium]
MKQPLPKSKVKEQNAKGKMIFHFTLCALLFASIAPTFGAWQQLGPQGATVQAMTNVPGYPDELFLVVGRFPSFILHTTDAGRTWSEPETIPDIITAICVNPSAVRTLYAGGRTRKVYKSTNGGASWQVVGNLTGDVWVQQIMVNPQNPSEVWAGAEVYSGDSVGINIYYSTNGGVSWSPGTPLLSFEAKFRALLVDHLHPGRAFVAGSTQNRARLFLTTNYGASWQDKSSGLGGRSAYGIAIVPNDSAAMVCATDSGIYYTSNQGETWTRRIAAPAYSVGFAPLSPYYGYAGGENLVYRSNDYGWTWRADTTTFFGTNTRFLAINSQHPLEVYAGNSYGVFFTTNGGYDWSYRTSSMRNLNVSFLYNPGGESLFAGVEGYGVIKSTNLGLNWELWGRPFPGSGWVKSIAVNPRNPDTVVCVTGFDSRLHVTIDKGDSWESFPIALNFEPQGVAYHPAGYDTIYTWGGKRDSANGPARFAIFRSTDQGQTWNQVLLRDEGVCRNIIFSPYADTIIAYGSSGDAAVFRSTDRGRNWTSLVSGLSGKEVLDLKVMRSQPNVWFCATSAGVFKTENSGLYWTNLGLENVTTILPDTISPNRVWAGTDTQGFYWTTNNGAIWERDTLGLPGRSITFLLRHPARQQVVYAGVCGHSLIGKNAIGLEEGSGVNSKPARVSVYPSAVIHYVRIVVEPAPDNVRIHDASGRLVAHIFPDPSGVCEWRRPPHLAPGVYFITVRVGKKWASGKVLLLPER